MEGRKASTDMGNHSYLYLLTNGCKLKFCIIHWMLALALWLGVFEGKTDTQVHGVIFNHGRDILRPQSKLKIRTEWLSVLIILVNCLRHWSDKNHHIWDRTWTMAAMLYMMWTSWSSCWLKWGLSIWNKWTRHSLFTDKVDGHSQKCLRQCFAGLVGLLVLGRDCFLFPSNIFFCHSCLPLLCPSCHQFPFVGFPLCKLLLAFILLWFLLAWALHFSL